MSIPDGYATLKMAYDARGNVTRQSYYGVNGEAVLSKKDGYQWEATYDDRGNQTIVTYLGLDEKPMRIADGYATMKMVYDARGDVRRMTFYDVNGNPALSKKNGSYGWEAEYDDKGNRTAITYLNKDGKPRP